MAAGTLDHTEEVEKLAPPSFRDREIFEAVAINFLPQDEAAADYGVSQARISQIVAGVRAWTIAATNEATGDLPPELALRYATRLVRMRLENLLSLAMTGFRDSQGLLPVRTTHEKDLHRTTSETMRHSFGDLRFLTHYRQVALLLAKLDGVNLAPKRELPAGSPERMLAALVGILQANADAEEGDADEAAEEAAAKAKAAAPVPVPVDPAPAAGMTRDLYEAMQEVLDRQVSTREAAAARDVAAATYAVTPVTPRQVGKARKQAYLNELRAADSAQTSTRARENFLAGAVPLTLPDPKS